MLQSLQQVEMEVPPTVECEAITSKLLPVADKEVIAPELPLVTRSKETASVVPPMTESRATAPELRSIQENEATVLEISVAIKEVKPLSMPEPKSWLFSMFKFLSKSIFMLKFKPKYMFKSMLMSESISEPKNAKIRFFKQFKKLNR